MRYLFVIALGCFALAVEAKSSFDSTVAKFKKLSGSVSVSVVDLNSGKEILDIGAAQKLSPASLTKLISSALVLEQFGPDYRLKTELLSSVAKPNAKAELPDLYIRGYGDPMFITEDLYIVTQELRLMGVKKISGDLVLDTSFFNATNLEINETTDHSTRAYSAKLSATSLNFNSVTLKPVHGDQGCRLSVDPIDTGYIQLNTEGKLNTGDPIRGKLLSSSNDSEKYKITGCLKTGYVSVQNPSMYFAQNLKKFLELQGIEHSGAIRFASTPKSASVLYSHPSKPLYQLIDGMNSFSNNFMSEMILLHAAAEKYGAPASYEKATKLIDDYVSKIDKSGASLVNGSGLTAENTMSCRFATKLLERISQNQLHYSAYYMSLARTGKPGTLEKRKGVSELTLAAKTGTLTSPFVVSGLAGYLQTPQNKNLAFCILINKQKDLSAAKQLQDELVLAISEKY